MHELERTAPLPETASGHALKRSEQEVEVDHRSLADEDDAERDLSARAKALRLGRRRRP